MDAMMRIHQRIEEVVTDKDSTEALKTLAHDGNKSQHVDLQMLFETLIYKRILYVSKSL